ncbi:hypothetical protein GGR16_003249 [Chelatococcus caeni]|uniref:Mor transcription activator domain-containing protein n=1 Tax=Chelatococcus caeni TaxID=1348468 RepID=A0A840BXZ1_9HYPH|nr:hypothetical protein [Chelatococcus caeni]MBB4018215.1 hypothetical protein [Chelatococcus caeni]
MSPSWLPSVLRTIADAAGLDVALVLAERYGGRRVDLPVRLHEGNWLVEAVGWDAARAIVESFGPGRLDIPLGPAGTFARMRREIDRRYAELENGGASAARIASELGMTERAIRQRRARRRAMQAPDRRQKSLF